jgi:copper(I)-binding protein
MDCGGWGVVASARLDGEVSPAEARALDAHLQVCSSCAATVAQLERLHRLVRVQPAPAVPDLATQILAGHRVRRRRRPILVGAVAAWVLTIAVAAAAIAIRSPSEPPPRISPVSVSVTPGEEGGVAEVYLYLDNAGGSDRLVGISTPAAARAVLHRTQRRNGIRVMEMTTSLPVPAEGGTVLEPEGSHLMLVGLHHDLAPGDAVPLRLELARAGSVDVVATVISHPG